MRVLIVGGTGVISTAVVNEAVNQGVDVTCINRGNNHGVKPNSHVKTMHFDVRNRKVADEHLLGLHYDVVVDFICFNANQVKYSLDLFHDKCNQYVFISTDSVYKLQKDGHYDENTPQSNPEWNYSYEKAECEEIVRSYCKENNLIYTIVRPSITYGNTRIPYGLMPQYGYHGTIIERIKAGKAIPTWNQGRNYQTVMRIEDFATGMIGLWGNEKAFNQDFGICGEIVTWGDILDAMEKAIGVKIKRQDVSLEQIFEVFPERKGEFLIDRAEDHKVDNSKLKEAVTSFTIKYNLRSGIGKTVEYYKENNNLLGIDYRFDSKLDYLITLSTGRRDQTSFVKYGKYTLKDRFSYLVAPYDNCKLFKYSNALIRLPYRFARILFRIIK